MIHNFGEVSVCHSRKAVPEEARVEVHDENEQEVERRKWKHIQVLTFVLCLCQVSPEGSAVFKILH